MSNLTSIGHPRQTPLQQCDKLFADTVHRLQICCHITEPDRSLVCDLDVSRHLVKNSEVESGARKPEQSLNKIEIGRGPQKNFPSNARCLDIC
jgi:hypothetical protein